MLLGCIGDDFTGSSDLANTLARGGMRVVQYSGTPNGPAEPGVEAGVVALKSRTIPPEEAVRLSLHALEWLMEQGCRQILFKYCSTFDSTPEGNIGPVIDALMRRLDADRTIVCPAFPKTGRSIYQGHLFVGDRLLSESGMENHPLTPMRDADIRRWLQPQTRHQVGHVAIGSVFGGADAIRAALDREVGAGRPVIVVDAIRDEDLHEIGKAAAGLRLVTGGSGIALGLPANLLDGERREAGGWAGLPGPAAILSGSCSNMTRQQVRRYAERAPSLEVTPQALMDGRMTARSAATWALDTIRSAVPLVYTSAEPEAVRAAQEAYGREAVAARIEDFFAETARRLTAGGVERLIVAGGETSGAVVEGLEIAAFGIGPEIAPGVPALEAIGLPLRLALKSGNFGDPDFFTTALAVLEAPGHV
jgi:uncharacterized protein YgbK (DUF1537 family)